MMYLLILSLLLAGCIVAQPCQDNSQCFNRPSPFCNNGECRPLRCNADTDCATFPYPNITRCRIGYCNRVIGVCRVASCETTFNARCISPTLGCAARSCTLNNQCRNLSFAKYCTNGVCRIKHCRESCGEIEPWGSICQYSACDVTAGYCQDYPCNGSDAVRGARCDATGSCLTGVVTPVTCFTDRDCALDGQTLCLINSDNGRGECQRTACNESTPCPLYTGQAEPCLRNVCCNTSKTCFSRRCSDTQVCDREQRTCRDLSSLATVRQENFACTRNADCNTTLGDELCVNGRCQVIACLCGTNTCQLLPNEVAGCYSRDCNDRRRCYAIDCVDNQRTWVTSLMILVSLVVLCGLLRMIERGRNKR